MDGAASIASSSQTGPTVRSAGTATSKRNAPAACARAATPESSPGALTVSQSAASAPGFDSMSIAVHQPTLGARDRLVVILVLVFGQQIDSVVRLSWDAVTIADELVTITLGASEIALPAPLDEPLRELAADRRGHRTAAHPDTNWIFRGYNPGQHLHPGHLRTRLRREFSARAARLGTLHELTRLAPVPIIAEALGYSPKTIERHAVASATTYSQYIAAIRDAAVGK